MRNVLLCHLPQWSIQQPPVGIALIASSLRKNGICAETRDLNIELFTQLKNTPEISIIRDLLLYEWFDHEYYRNRIYPIIEPYLNTWAEEIADSDFDIIGFTLLMSNVNASYDLAQKIKEKNSKKLIIMGGPHVCGEYKYEIIRKPFIDIAAEGEGEEVIKEIIDNLEKDEDLDNIKGIIFKKSNDIIFTGQRKLIENLDDLPFPYYGDNALKEYESIQLPIVGSRGCIYNCSFCSEKKQWRSYRFRTGKNILDEIDSHISNHGYSDFYFIDSLINGNMKELENFCNLILLKNNRPNFAWYGKASIRKEMTKLLLLKMKSAGCFQLQYGLESGSSSVLKRMNKNPDLDIVSRVFKDTHDAGIKVMAFFIVGFPTETEENFIESLDFLKRNKTNIDVIVTVKAGCVLGNGSDLFENHDKYGIKTDSNKSFFDWYSEHSSPEIRKDRVERLRCFCNENNIEINIA